MTKIIKTIKTGLKIGGAKIMPSGHRKQNKQIFVMYCEVGVKRIREVVGKGKS